VDRVVELAGGVGGARLAHGLQAVLGAALTVVVNTADDLERHGMAVWPDHDTVMHPRRPRRPERGWGLADETWTVIEQLGRYGEETWFRLGDRDIATHIARTARLRQGDRPTDVALHLQRALGALAAILPMTDDRVRTAIRTDEGWLAFQEYFVQRHQEPTVREVRFDGVETARPTPDVLAALDAAAAIVIAPSNPIVSVGPILTLPGIREALLAARARGARIVAVSGIVGGKALRGPADRMLASLGHESSALGVARLYGGLADAILIDTLDAALGPAITPLGMRVVVTDTIMLDDAGRERLARAVLESAAGSIA
jgi:LPPG:FO 2-phospho-L-lactate transferase